MTSAETSDPVGERYPVGEMQPERVQSRSGRPLAALSLDNLLAGRLTAADFGIAAEGLRVQAGIAEQAGRPHLAQNLRRAAELVDIPDDVLLEVYDLLRPGRARHAADLLATAERLRRDFGAEENARLLVEAAQAYARRGILGRHASPGALPERD